MKRIYDNAHIRFAFKKYPGRPVRFPSLIKKEDELSTKKNKVKNKKNARKSTAKRDRVRIRKSDPIFDFKLIWKKLKLRLKGVPFISYLIIGMLVFIIGLAITMMFLFSFSADPDAGPNGTYKLRIIKKYTRDFITIKKIKNLKKSHKYYANISSKEILFTWIEMFSGFSYRLNGSMKFNEADCVAAVWWFLHAYGYNREIYNVQTTDGFIEKLSAAGYLKIRSKKKKYRDLRPGDLILFHPPKKGAAPHIGIAYAWKNNFICFVDVNGAVGRGDNRIKWNHKTVNKVAEISYALWAGKVFAKMNTTVVEEESKLEIKKMNPEIMKDIKDKLKK